MIPLLVTLTAVTRVARRFVSTGGRHHSSQMLDLSVAFGDSSPNRGAKFMLLFSCLPY